MFNFIGHIELKHRACAVPMVVDILMEMFLFLSLCFSETLYSNLKLVNKGSVILLQKNVTFLLVVP